MPRPLLHMPRPCDATAESGACPFRVDAVPGEFSAARYQELAGTAGRPGAEVPVDGPLFACHHTTDGASVACAGWLLVCGDFHFGVRRAVIDGSLPHQALVRRPDGPELFESYDVMAREQAAGVYDPDAAEASRRAAGHDLPVIDKLRGGYTLVEPAGCPVREDRFEQGAAKIPGARWAP